MTALAVYLAERGKRVWGSDVEEEYPTDAVLKENNITVLSGFDSRNITDDIDLVVTTGAHGGLDNSEVLEAKGRSINVSTLAQFVGEEAKHFKTVISVCGTHGKTTTSAMLAFVLKHLGMKASHLVGAPSFSGLNGGHYGGDDYLVIEADEYAASPGKDNTPRFMYQNPDIIICTNVDYDHPDVFPTVESMEQAYLTFFQKLDREKGVLIYCGEDGRLKRLVSKVDINHKYPYSLKDSDDSKLLIPGRHNLLNAAAVLTIADILKLDKSLVKKYLVSFSGSARRLEKIFEHNDTILYDDYAHHPKEIEATIEAIRSLYPQKRLIILFQSHTYSRTKQFLKEFVAALGKADRVIVTDIFASARETAEKIGGADFEKEAQRQGITTLSYCQYSEIVSCLRKEARRGDVIFTMGAGSLYQTHSGIIEILRKL